MQRRGLMLVLSSPSGAGKTTLSRRLLESDANLAMSISVTTRAPRPGEVNGRDYIFVDRKTFAEMRTRGELLESATVFENDYGTPRAPVETALMSGRDVLFDIDWQGAQQLSARVEGDLVKVFVLPPSAEILEERLRSRAQDSEEVVRRRMSKAADEISHWKEYDYVLVNDDVDRCVQDLTAILRVERLREARQTGLALMVQRLRDKL
jgi:guanylate kinase